MAIGNPNQVGTNTSQVSTHNSIAAASCVIPAASLVVVGVFNSAASIDPSDPTGVTDGTNNYTKDRSILLSGTLGRVSLWSFYDTAGRTATVTANFVASTTNMSWIFVFTVSSAASTSWQDTGATSSGFSTALAVTTAGNIAQNDEVSFGVYGKGDSTSTWTVWPGAGYTSIVTATNGTRGRQFRMQYKNGLTSGSTETSGGTVSANSNLGRIIETYKGAAVATALAPGERIVLQAVNKASVW